MLSRNASVNEYSTWKEYWWLAPVFFMLLTSYLYPLGYDNSTYQTMGWQLARFGKLPYLQTWDQNFPAIVYLHSLSILLFGNSTAGFRTLDILLQLGSVTLLYQFTRYYFGRKSAPYAALLFTGMYVFYGFGAFGQRDLYAAPLILAALFVTLRSQEGTHREYAPLLAGLLIGLAILFRPTNAICALPVAALYLRREGWLRSLSLFSLGGVVALLAGFAPYLNAHDLEQVYLATIRYNIDVYGSNDFRFSLVNALIAPIEWLFTPLLLVAGWFIWRKGSKGRMQSGVVIATLLAIILLTKIIIYWMGKYFMYQYGPIFYLGAPLITTVMVILFERYRVHQWMRVALMTCILLVLTFRRSPAEVLLESNASMDEVIDKINTRYKTSNWSTYHEMMAICDYVSKTTSPSDMIETCSWDNQIVWRTERQQSSRFTLIHPVGMRPDAGYTDYQEAWRTELASTIEAKLPKLVLLASAPYSFTGFIRARPDNVLLGIPGFKEALYNGYRSDTTIACWHVYRRKD